MIWRVESYALVESKVVISTDSGVGTGRATALLFAEAGARVVIKCRCSEPPQTLIQNQDNLDFVLAEAANPEDASRTLGTVVERWELLDVLVNNAGAGAILPLATTSAAISEIFAVNVFGPSPLFDGSSSTPECIAWEYCERLQYVRT